MTDAAIAGQHFESAPDFSLFHDVYTRPRKTVSALMRVLPTSWTPYAEEQRAINMGIFGGRDLGTITEYCRQARQLVEHTDNRAGWKLMGSVCGVEVGVHNIGWSNMVIKQQTVYCVARQRNMPMTMLFEKDALPEADAVGSEPGYTHVMGEKRRPVSSAFMRRLESTVAARYPEAWGRIRRGFDLTRQQDSTRRPFCQTGLHG